MYQHGLVVGLPFVGLALLGLAILAVSTVLAYHKYYLVLMGRTDRRLRSVQPKWPIRHAQELLLVAWIVAQVVVSLGSNLVTRHWYHPFTGKTLLLVVALGIGAVGLRGLIMSIVAYTTARVRLANEARSLLELELTNQMLAMGASLCFTVMAILMDAGVIFLP